MSLIFWQITGVFFIVFGTIIGGVATYIGQKRSNATVLVLTSELADAKNPVSIEKRRNLLLITTANKKLDLNPPQSIYTEMMALGKLDASFSDPLEKLYNRLSKLQDGNDDLGLIILSDAISSNFPESKISKKLINKE